MLIVAAFLMCGGSKTKGRHNRLSFCAYIMEGVGDGCPIVSRFGLAVRR